MDEAIGKVLEEMQDITKDSLEHNPEVIRHKCRKKVAEWSKWYGWKPEGSLMKTALILSSHPATRNCLNRLILIYWRVWDGVSSNTPISGLHPESLTQVQTIIRARTKVIKKIKELGFTDPIQKERSRKGKGEPEPESGLQEEQIL